MFQRLGAYLDSVPRYKPLKTGLSNANHYDTIDRYGNFLSAGGSILSRCGLHKILPLDLMHCEEYSYRQLGHSGLR